MEIYRGTARMLRTLRKTRPLLAAMAIVGSAAADAWTPFGFGPYGPDYQSAGPPPDSQVPAEQGLETGTPPTPDHPTYGVGPQLPFPGRPYQGPEGYGAQQPAYPPYGAGPGFPGMGRPGYGGPPGRLQISRRATEDSYIIEVQLNGMKPEEVQVSTRGNWISVGRDQSRHEVREDNFDQGRGYSRSYSFSSGSASRRFSVPGDADLEAMTQEESEGVLRIFIPRRRR